MLLIWRGWGILVVVVTVLCIVAARALAEKMMGTPLPVNKAHVVTGVSLVIAAAAAYGLHLAIQKDLQPRIVVDQATGQRLRLVKRHDLFFIPIKFWAALLLGFGILSFFK